MKNIRIQFLNTKDSYEMEVVESTTCSALDNIFERYNQELDKLRSQLRKYEDQKSRRNMQIKDLKVSGQKLANIIVLLNTRKYNETDTETLNKIRKELTANNTPLKA